MASVVRLRVAHSPTPSVPASFLLARENKVYLALVAPSPQTVAPARELRTNQGKAIAVSPVSRSAEKDINTEGAPELVRQDTEAPLTSRISPTDSAHSSPPVHPHVILTSYGIPNRDYGRASGLDLYPVGCAGSPRSYR